MLKLYRLDANPARYWETWEADEGSHIVHWGILGERGEYKTLWPSDGQPVSETIQREIDALIPQGYGVVDDDDHRILLIEYAVKDFASPEELKKRHRLQARMDETLGWHGLGHCDGGSSGSGTMEACCYVVDFNIAKAVIETDLKGTEFADYIRIYDEAADNA